MTTPEQKARDLLERMGVPGAQAMSAGDVGELAELIAERDRLAAAIDDEEDLEPSDTPPAGGPEIDMETNTFRVALFSTASEAQAANVAARASLARLSDLSKPIHDPQDQLAQVVLMTLAEGGDSTCTVEIADLAAVGLDINGEAYALWLRRNGIRQMRRRGAQKTIGFCLPEPWGGPLR